ncbi:MAG: hypothetical protein ABIT37_16905 [Luteolibacter sp.]
MKIYQSCLLSILSLVSPAFAEVSVKTEQLKPGDATWKFKGIPGPSKSDIAEGAEITRTAGNLDPSSATVEMLINGKLPAGPGDLPQCAFFAGLSSFVMDLGKPQPVAAVNSYSWHEFADDQGARGPQVYTLSGSNDRQGWTTIADVDTRPNKNGDGWGGKHGASITDSTGKLGDFRYLKFDVQPTYSPKQGNVLWTNTLFNEIDVHTATTLAKAGDATTAEPVKVTDVWVVFKTHFDLGFTDQAENVFERYRVEMMDKALGAMDQNRTLPANQRFTWTVPGWPLDAQILGPKQDPARKARIEQAVKEGTLAVHALGGTAHTESFDLETLVRDFAFSDHVARTYGRPLPIAAKLTDVPSHSWVLPTLLEHAGVKFLHIGCNPASQWPRVPPLFWWQGADGSRVLTAYTLDYGGSLLPPPNWPARNYLAMIMTGDNHGPPSPAEVASYRQQLETALPGVHVHLGTLDDFAKATLAENPDLPVVRGDMPDTWIHGLLSNPAATKSFRNTQALEPALDALDTQLRVWGLTPSPLKESLAKAYEQTFLYGEHTWGMNAEFGPRTAYGENWKKWLADMEKEPVPADGDYTRIPRGSKRKWMQSYQDHRDYALTAEKIVTKETDDRLALLAANVEAGEDSIVVYNALPWKRSGFVEVNGNQLYAKDVPAGGYLTMAAPPEKFYDSDATTLETPFFKVVFDLERGGISSLIEKSSGRELADKASPYALGQYLHERFSTNEVNRFFHPYSRMQSGWGLNDLGKPGMPDAGKMPYQASTPGGWELTVDRDSAGDRAVLTTTQCDDRAKGYRLTFTFPHDAAWVDTEWQVAAKAPEKHPEGGWLCFPFAVENPHFTVGRPGAPIDPTKDIVPGSNRHLMAVASGVAITGEDASGAALCPIDSPLISLGQPGLWWWTMDFVPKKPVAFVILYNNMWNTNFPLWQEGSWSERVRFWPLAARSKTNEELAVRSWEARLPLLGAAVTAQNGTLPATNGGVEVSRPGVLVTAFGENIDGKGIVLRVWDQTGESGDLTVTVPGKFTTATPVDLRGENPGHPLPVRNGRITTPLKAYAPASFILN